MADALPPIQSWESKLDLVRRTVAQGATDDEFETFLHQARRAGLDPLARQIHYVKRGGKGTVQVGIDGLRLIADRTGLYAGNDDAEFEHAPGGSRFPVAARVAVHKMVMGHRCEFSATARWDEYYPGDAMGFQWKKMPHVMLAKCAEALALRKAFPADTSGLYTDDEMAQADARAGGDEPPPTAPAAAPAPKPTAPVDRDAKAVAATMAAIPDKAADIPDDVPDAFGYRPQRWPTKKMWGEEITESQRTMMSLKADERSLEESLRPALRRLVLEAYGVEERESKGAASLFIDWLINVDESGMDLACEAAEAVDSKFAERA